MAKQYSDSTEALRDRPVFLPTFFQEGSDLLAAYAGDLRLPDKLQSELLTKLGILALREAPYPTLEREL
jgi:hypothetical protein